MSKSTPSSVLWAFLIIGVAGLVMVVLAVSGVVTAGIITALGIILLAAGIIGFGFITIAPSRSAPPLSNAKLAASAVEMPPPPAPPAPVETVPEPAADPEPVASEPVVLAVADPEPVVLVEADPEPVASEPVVLAVADPEPVVLVEAVPPPASIEEDGATSSGQSGGFSSVQRTGSFTGSGAAALNTSEWVFARESSPAIQHSYRIRARQTGGSSAVWFQGGGIVDVSIDNVPTGQFMVIANQKSAKEDVVGGSTYRIEMYITSDGLAPSKVDTHVTVDGIPLEATNG